MATHYGASDLPTMVGEFGVPVVFVNRGEVYTGKALLDEADEELLRAEGGGFAGRVMRLEYITEDFPGLAADAVLTVDGEDYTVLFVRLLEDGAMSRALLRPA